MTLLDRELQDFVEEGALPMIRHPLVYAVPFFETETEILRLNNMLKRKREALQQAMDKRDWNSYIFLHERPYRANAMCEMACEMDDAVYWPLLRQVWVDSENIFQNHMIWWEMLTAPRKKRELFSDCADRKALRRMPATLEIFRGTRNIEVDSSYMGFSWTLDRERAGWFARRFQNESEDGSPVIASATVRRSRVVGHISVRGEAEIVVEPRHLRKVQWEVLDVS